MKACEDEHGLELLLATQSEDGAAKYAYRLFDGEVVESVILRHENMTCACISSQVGCPLDCVFCATASIGFTRNLSAEEIKAQVLSLGSELQKAKGWSASFERVLFMGMGEPMLNYEAVVQASLLFRKGPADVFLATSGNAPERIHELARDAPFIRLWVSLCASDDNLRAMLMPAASSTSITTLLDTAESYAERTGDPVRLSYLMISELTDSLTCAKRLVALLRGRPFQLQLSRINPIPGSSLRGSSNERVREFAEFGNHCGIPTTVFESKGSDILAACGQLSRTLGSGSLGGS